MKFARILFLILNIGVEVPISKHVFENARFVGASLTELKSTFCVEAVPVPPGCRAIPITPLVAVTVLELFRL